MGEKKAEDLFIEDGEYNAPALRGAFEKWVGRGRSHENGTEFSITVQEGNSTKAVCFKSFDNWVNRQVDDDWFKDVKEEYGMGEPREIFYSYWESNDEFREKALSHVEGTDEWYERRGEDPAYHNGDGDGDDTESNEGDQSSLGEGQFPQLHDVGVVDDNANVNKAKMRGLVLAFTDEVEEIRGGDREFDIIWAMRAYLYWGMDKFGDEWLKLAIKDVNNNDIYDAVEWAYENHDEASSRMEKKFRGNFDIELGNPDTGDALEHLLDAEVPGWNGENEEEGCESNASKWEEFEQKSKEKDDDGRRDEDTEKSGDGHTGDTDDDTGDDDSSSNPESIGDWAKKEGSTDSIYTPSRTRGGSGSKSSGLAQRSKSSSSGRNETTTIDAGVECEDFGRPHEIQWPEVGQISEFERNRIYQGNTFEWAMKLPNNSVDTMVTSPPYYSLRDYDIEDAFPISGDFTCDHKWEDEFCTECGAFLGQLGHEPDPATFVEHIVDLMARYKKVLKPTGSLWLNIGDTYAGEDFDGRVKAKEKSRMMIPDRIYRRMVQTGWHLRDYVIWAKKVWMPDDDLKGNGKPFAGNSRIANQWEPMVRFTPEPDHYSDVDSNRLKPPSFSGDLGSKGIEGKFREGEDTQRGKTYNELGTNPPDVWLINSDGYDGDHRAVFPEELPKRCINLTTPDRVCEMCGTPYEKEVHVEDGNKLSAGGDYATYYQQCHCDSGHEPGVAFDPFLGSGTTGVAASNNGFDWAGVELSEKYAELARERIPTGRQVGLSQY